MKTYIDSSALRFAREGGGFSLTHKANGEPLLLIPGSAPFVPVIDGKRAAATVGEIVARDGLWEIPLTTAGPVEGLTVFIKAEDDALDLWCEFRVTRDCALNALEIFPERSGLNLYDVVNFRNRHFTAATWPELLIGRDLETTTYSNDWQFAPHPSAFLLRKNRLSLFAGFLDLQASFGMRLKVHQSLVQEWLVDFGTEPHGLPLQAGETFRSARLRLFLREDRSVHEMYAEFGQMLVRAGSIPDPAIKERAAWWSEPLYCTWGDQWMLANHKPAVELIDQTAGESLSAEDQLTEELVGKAVDVIHRKKLPVKIFLLDAGWETARGDWRPRLPNFRKLVDGLHAAGFKVVVWWNWAEIAPKADIPASELAGGGWLNRHGNRWRDYSDPAVQNDYFRPLFRKLFSSDSDCYDLDGVKTDFLADKVHPDTPVHDPAWRGEEKYFFKMTELFWREMRRHKPDAMHLGCAGHYWLAQFIDLNRTYDVHSSNWLEHEERAKMLMCTSPGAQPSYDMMTCTENTPQFFESARQLGAAVEIGNVLVCRDNNFSAVRAADDEYWAMLRAGLSQFFPSTF